MRRISCTLIAAGLTTALAASPSAQTPPPRPDNPRASQPREGKARQTAAADMEFAQKAAEGGKKEVESARMALNKATNPDVKQYANRLITDHTKTNAELEAIVKDKRMSPPQRSETAAKEAWRDETGAAFDRAWIDHAIADHEKTIALYETEARQGTDAELKAFAQKTLPALREHLQAARDLKTKTTSSRQ